MKFLKCLYAFGDLILELRWEITLSACKLGMGVEMGAFLG